MSAMGNPGQETVLLKVKFWVVLLVALSTTSWEAISLRI